jgi:uncharacterized membrane protein YidH (DUF202 family)|tara:strand:- start:232813 stop:233058 length:246 start_codon:yes stop_codon:yes gene_type:complete
MTYQQFIAKIEAQILVPIITLLSLAAFVLFVWGVVQFMANSENDEKRKIGQQHMLWGIIGLVIMFGANAIIALIRQTVGAV